MFNLVMFLTAVILFMATMARGPEFGFGVFVGGLVVAALHWLWRNQHRFSQPSHYSRQSEPVRPRTGPFSQRQGAQQNSSKTDDHRQRPIYKKLVLACGGDRAKADRLIAFEMTRDRSISPATATVEALDRLQRDRSGY